MLLNNFLLQQNILAINYYKGAKLYHYYAIHNIQTQIRPSKKLHKSSV